MIEWRWCPFDELGVGDLYALMGLRQRVFVLEQRCAYVDADGRDPLAWHLLGIERGDDGGRLVAGARVFARHPEPGHEASIGRVVVDRERRGRGLGHALMAEALARCASLAPGRPILLRAQVHLERFYGAHGFRRRGGPYLHDGIVQIDMLRSVDF